MRAALEFLRARIRSKFWSQGNRLPTTSELASQALVSIPSMSRAIRVLTEEGVLDARPRRGIILCSKQRLEAPAPRIAEPPRPNKVQSVASELVSGILAGNYGRSDELPSLKELQESFGVCFRTLKQAMNALVDEGVLTRRKRGYRLRNPSPSAAFKTLVMVVGRDHAEHLSKHSYARSYFYPLLYALERECSRRNVQLEIEPLPRDISGFARRKHVIGYLMVLDGEPRPESVQMIAQLLRFKVPVLVTREADHPAFKSIPTNPHLVFLEDSNELAGFQVGQHLLARGFQRATYLTHSASSGWSRERHRGLERAFRLAGKPNVVTALNVRGVLDDLPAERDLLRELLRQRRGAAWVACDDVLACYTLLPFLREQGVTLGAGVSVMGFNDQLEAFQNRLTSYNFNAEGIAAAVLFHTQFPARKRFAPRRSRDPIVIGGYIIDRGSVRAA